MSADGAIALEPRDMVGGNSPPADPFDGFNAHISDLLDEAKNFLDGEGIQDQGGADAISKLMDMIRTASKDADAARVLEKKPHDDAAKAVQTKWKPLLDRCELAVTTCKNALSPWLRKLEEEKRAAAEELRRVAEAKAVAAVEAVRAAQSTDLDAQEGAELMLRAAKRAEAEANRAEADKAHAKGGARATGLRSYFTPEMVDAREALKHYLAVNPQAIKDCLLALAKTDVASGKRQIPGFTITEERRVV